MNALNLRVLFSLLSVLALVPEAGAQPVHFKTLVIDQAYARATAPGQEVGVIYMTIENTGKQDQHLLTATAPVARAVTLHSTHMSGGMSSMHRQASFAIPAGSKLELQPSGLHLMLEGLKKPLVEGKQIVVRLRFEPAGEVEVPVPVRSMGAGPGMGSMHH
ncbi:MAG: copper chaperone PCu(A)C [Betaproteobacteria bacterium]|nr:copper chaperone PCu(A)C [Betaproteobacteria bacterium]MDE2622195.1 copper chaperone PCu(A)C [Betaproteobacteria bacterium]